MRTAEIAQWINEREAVRMRKALIEERMELGFAAQEFSNNGLLAWGMGGWELNRLTKDPILQRYRFCNVRREDDRVTRWIRESILVPYAEHEFLPIMICITRTINWPDTLAELIKSPDCWPSDPRFTPERMTHLLDARKSRGEKIYSNAYMIRAESDPKKTWYSWTKQRYVSEIVIGELWKNRGDWQHLDSDETAQSQGVWEYLQMFTGWGPFMAGQVVTDMKHTPLLRDCSDWNTWTALGPGSMRGLNRYHNRPIGQRVSQEQGLVEMLEIKVALDEPGVIWPWLQPLELSDVQNCLCEYDKYQRALLGQGRPKSNYVPGRGS